MNDQNKGSEQKTEKTERTDSKSLLEAIKKLASLGVSAIFMTEDAVRGALQDIPLPKEILNGLLEQLKNNKDEFIYSIKTDFKNYLSSINPSREIEKIIEKYDINIQAKLSLEKKPIKNDSKEEPSEHT